MSIESHLRAAIEKHKAKQKTSEKKGDSEEKKEMAKGKKCEDCGKSPCVCK